MLPEQVPEIILSTLAFNASVLTLLLAAQGFVLLRMWPEGATLFRWRLLWLLPAFTLSVYASYSVANDYLALIQSVTSRSVIQFAANWINGFWRFYGILVLAIIATGVSAAKARAE